MAGGINLATLRPAENAEDQTITGSGDSEVRLVPVVATHRPTVCARCGSDRLYRHDKREQRYADVPHFARPTHLLFIRQRWRCQQCTLVFPDPSADLDETHNCTKRLITHIGEMGVRSTFAEIARTVGIADVTVAAIFKEHVKRLEATYRFEVPEILGIDEVKIIGDYRCMITNIGHLTVYDMLPSRRMDSLRSYFKTFPDPQRVKVFCTDLWNSYAVIARDYFPKAVVVADRFHIQRMGNNALEKVRKEYRKTLTKHARIQLKDDRKLLLKNGRDLSERQREALERIFSDHPVLRSAWECKEGFVEIYDAAGPRGARMLIRQWLDGVPQDLAGFFAEPISTLRNREDHIVNYFDHPFTNGYTEAANALVKGMNRMGRGYSFEAIRAKMLYNPKALAKSAVRIEQPPSAAPGAISTTSFNSIALMPSSRSDAGRMRYYGPHIPTLVEMLENGEFEDPKSPVDR